ncbi:Small permease component of tripartite tricarboxylate transporter [Alloalcanivorax dieselolei B5]|uniref:Small permease component of tripartite tricarboxylate transporter n=1 Tax=Alcanivorax dieselolei (strain DSM 16502 / CGMCC 1.3690 / MCCC 1A00001 / B-5) TaxID=930169 RepID=K0CDC4_ALCDB|nr:tripartite tricarboxylate transporter TctB family protein [Alloalcanivorax dieselolei]AFT69647.1 Small permease component of tripartite tricarboxylate transporter [Alloalcanivorax dieselolei B5]GGK03459.1 membrane protein [Alloalcanivorax dieselolei]
MARPFNGLQIGAAALLALLGLFIIWQGSDYSMGSLRRMGPGFFPVMMGSVLLLFSLLVVWEVRREEKQENLWVPRPILMICAGFIAFAALLESVGLVPATLALVILVSLAEKPVRPVATVATAAGLCVLGVLVFLYGFGIPVAAIQW